MLCNTEVLVCLVNITNRSYATSLIKRARLALADGVKAPPKKETGVHVVLSIPGPTGKGKKNLPAQD